MPAALGLLDGVVNERLIDDRQHFLGHRLGRRQNPATGKTALRIAGQLRFFGDLASLAAPAVFATWLRPLRAIRWVVYTKRPFGGPEQVLDYLGRYTHRVAIANSRLVALTEGRVRWRRDRRPWP